MDDVAVYYGYKKYVDMPHELRVEAKRLFKKGEDAEKSYRNNG